MVEIEAVEGAIGKGEVELVAIPGVGSPPIAGGAPGAGDIGDGSLNARSAEMAGFQVHARI